MAMNNSNYSYQPPGYSPGYSSPYSSTPSGIRTQRPRFGYSGPSLYPRPRSSASKPNPDSFSDSMINNYGSSSSQIDPPSFNNGVGKSYDDSYPSSSNYYTANDSYPEQYSDPSLLRNDTSYTRDSPLTYNEPIMARGYSGMRGYPNNENKFSGIFPNPSTQYNAQKFNYNLGFGGPKTDGFKGNFKNPPFSHQNSNPPFKKKFIKGKRTMATKPSAWRCEICSLDFTSQIPHDMHLRGAKHAKKIKANQALSAVQLQGADGEKSLFCELCNVKANSSLQLQTHLEGSKHKNKLQPKDQPQEDSKEQTNAAVNGKTNGSLVRTLPSDFETPQPNKLAKYACEVCCVTVNSEVQLQQHLTSKKHQNKVEGKPVIKGKKNKAKTDTDTDTDTAAAAATGNTETMETEQTSNEASAKVMGVKTLASSFVQGGTLQ